MGLSGAGKTTLSKKLTIALTNSIHINADNVRKQFNDWDFSIDGRFRQCNRLKFLSEHATNQFVICDFIAPTDSIRTLFDADFTIFVDTCQFCKYHNTNVIFEPPTTYDVRVSNYDFDFWVNHIKTIILSSYVNTQTF